MKRFFIFFPLFLFVCISLLFIAFFYLRQTPSETVMLEKIKVLNRLETVVYSFEKIIQVEKNTQGIPKILIGDKMLFVAYGEVYAGVDLSKLQEADIRKENDRIEIHLPPAEIFSVRIDPKKSYVYDRQTGIFTKGEKNLEQDALIKAEQTIRQAACTTGILEQATLNAQKQLNLLLTKIEMKGVSITTQNSVCQ